MYSLGWSQERPLRVELAGSFGERDPEARASQSISPPARPQTAREDAERLLATHGYPKAQVFGVDAEGAEVVVLARQDNRLMEFFVHFKPDKGRVFVRMEEGW